MWLLDANVDVHLIDLLNELGVLADTAGRRGWKSLSNGQLVSAAVENGFSCLLTRDRLFAESASRALRLHSDFAVVLVKLSQQRWPEYRKRFLDAWQLRPIKPQAGYFTEWPDLT